MAFFNKVVFKLLFILFFSVQAIAESNVDFSIIDIEKKVPAELLKNAFNFYTNNLDRIKNQRYIVVIDYKVHNSIERFYLIDVDTGDVETFLVAHGKNSDPDYDGFATLFSNNNNSNKTSLGFYLTAETYYGENGYSLKLDGLSSTNSNARARAIVIHGANYVRPGGKIGRSFGCPALEMRFVQDVIDRIKGGALIYAGLSK